MAEFTQYIAEEIALDHADGMFGRREAIRRLGLLGLSAAAASTVLAACSSGGESASATSSSAAPGGSSKSAVTTTSSGSPEAPGAAGALPTRTITFPGQNGELQGAYAAATNPKGVVLVIHENKGLTPHIASIAGRLAGAGYSALAVDLLSEEGGTSTFGDTARATAALGTISNDRFVSDEKAAITELQRRVPGKKVGVIGFCFGGGQVWSLLASGEPQLSAAIPLYGPLPQDHDFAGSRNAAVLAVYAGLDNRVNAGRAEAEKSLGQAGLTHEILTVPNVDHAFFNDTGGRYDQAAATEVWGRALDWFGRYLA